MGESRPTTVSREFFGVAPRPCSIVGGMQRQRLFSFMLDHLQPLSLQTCVFFIVEQRRRALVSRLCVGTPEWWAAVEAGVVAGGLLDLRTVDLSALRGAFVR